MFKFISLLLLMTTTTAVEVFQHPNSKFEFQGCPTNSSCTQKLGIKFGTWSRIITNQNSSQLKNFIKTEGQPIKVWSLSGQHSDRITYDSSCANHRQKDAMIYESIVFAKSTNDLKNKDIIVNKTFSFDEREFFIPVKSIPSSIKDGKLHFQQEFDGSFYDLEINNNLSSTLGLSPARDFHEMACDESLVKKFKSWSTPKNLFLGHFCKMIWDFDQKKYIMMIFGWSC